MDDSGAEALEDYEIKEIPKVKISKEQLRNSLQCSVCLDYFKVNEEAKVLPCNHHFHEGCIDPWLELRGTCPDCRRNLVPDFAIGDTEELDIDEETLSGYESAHSNMIPSYVSIVSYDRFHDNAMRVAESVNGNIYYEDIEDDEEMAEEGVFEQCSLEEDDESRHLNDIYSNDVTASFSIDTSVTMTARSPTSPMSDEDADLTDLSFPKWRWGDSSPGDASGSSAVNVVDDTLNDTTSPSIITVSDDTSDDDVEISGNSFEPVILSEASSESSFDRMSIESESLEEISIASSSDILMQED